MRCTSLSRCARIIQPLNHYPRIWFEALEPRRVFSAPPGGFGVDGIAKVDFDAEWVQPIDMAIAPDGKIVLVGQAFGAISTTDRNFQPSWWAVARLNADGSPDPTFGPAGDGTLVLHLSDDSAADHVIVQPDGRIVVTGMRDDEVVVARLDSDGSLDTTFNGGIPVYPGFDAWIPPSHGAWGDSQGRTTLLGVGFTFAPITVTFMGHEFVTDEPYDNVLTVRLNPDGTPDESYGAGGTTAAAADDQFAARSLQLLAARPIDGGDTIVYLDDWTDIYARPGDVPSPHVVHMELDPAGHLVSIFSLDPVMPTLTGYHSPDGDGFGGNDYSVTLAPDGSAYVSTSQYDPRIQRLDPTGTTDQSFGDHGVATLPLNFITHTTVLPDGRILVQGGITYRDDTDTYDIYESVFLRLNANGSIDPTFSANFDGFSEFGWAALVHPLPNGSTLLASGNFAHAVGIQMLLPDGSVAPSVQDENPPPDDAGGSSVWPEPIDYDPDPVTTSDPNELAEIPPLDPGANSPFAAKADGLFADPAGATVFDPAGTRQAFDDDEENPFG